MSMIDLLRDELLKIRPVYREEIQKFDADGDLDKATVRFYFYKADAKKVAACIRGGTGRDIIGDRLKGIDGGFYIVLETDHTFILVTNRLSLYSGEEHIYSEYV